MLKLSIKTLLITCLLCLPTNDCAYLVLGPLELTQDNGQSENYEDGQETSGKSVPKREFKDKEKKNNTTPNIDDDAEVIQEIPFCTNLFRSSVSTKETKEPEKCRSESKENVCIKQDVKFHETVDRADNKPDKNEKSSVIDHLKRELAKERERVRNLTDELNLVKKLCEEAPTNIDYYDYEGLKGGKIKSIQSSLDLYNLINSKSVKDKTRKCPKCSVIKNDFPQNDKCFTNKEDLNNDEIECQSECSEISQHLNRNLLNDNIYQIPTFSINDHKSYKNSNLKSNVNEYGLIPQYNSNLGLPYTDRNYRGEDILKTLYPQFFLDDGNEPFDFITNSKRASGRSWIEPSQIYVNNMKQLTAPYKIFPGHTNSDLRYFNVRDRRDNVNDVRPYRKNLCSAKKHKSTKATRNGNRYIQSSKRNRVFKAKMKNYLKHTKKSESNDNESDEGNLDCDEANESYDESESDDTQTQDNSKIRKEKKNELIDASRFYEENKISGNESNINYPLIKIRNLGPKSVKLNNLNNPEDDDNAKESYYESEKEFDKYKTVENCTNCVTVGESGKKEEGENEDFDVDSNQSGDDNRTNRTGNKNFGVVSSMDGFRQLKKLKRIDDKHADADYFCDESKKDWDNDERDSEKETVTSKGTDEEVESLRDDSIDKGVASKDPNENESTKDDSNDKDISSIETNNDSKSDRDESWDGEPEKQPPEDDPYAKEIVSSKSSKKLPKGSTNPPFKLTESNDEIDLDNENCLNDNKTIIEDDETDEPSNDDDSDDDKERRKRTDKI